MLNQSPPIAANPSMPGIPALSQCVLFGIVGSLLVGALDVGIAIYRETETAASFDTFIAVLFGASVLIPVGVSAGLIFGLIERQISFYRLLSKLKRPRNTTILLITIAVSISLAAYVARRRGILIEAIDYRLPIFLFVFLLILISGAHARFSSPTAIGRFVWLLIVMSIAGTGTAMVLIHKSTDVPRLITEKTVLVNTFLKMVRSPFDRDGDGFPSALCSADCDCEDGDPTRNPAAIDIPENGVDEDCSGADLKLASEFSIEDESKFAYPKSFSPPYNIVLITVDALRADRMHVYGSNRMTTPNLDRFAAEGVRFAEVRSQGPSTRHVFPVLLTGRYFPSIHQSRGGKWWTLLADNTTFAEILKHKGYRTTAVMSYFRLEESSGFQQGFDVWDTLIDTDMTSEWTPTGQSVTKHGINHLDELTRSKSPWLLWLHYFDPHAAYLKHDDQPSFGQTTADMYDGEILYTDRQIGRFFDALKLKGLWDKTAIIVTADHGEAIDLETDHGFSYHGYSLYDSETKVPLILHLPGSSPGTISQCVALMDVPPTLLDLGGVKIPSTMHGVSLVPYAFGSERQRPPFLMHLPEDRNLEGVVDWPYKLIWEKGPNRFRLFNLQRDPGEQADLIEREVSEAKRLKDLMQLENYLLSIESKTPPPFAY